MKIGVILLLGLLLRLVNLNQSLWLDEAVQAITSQGAFGSIFFELQGDFHPPLYHFLIWVWVHLFGVTEISLRLPSVLLGVATIYIVYLIAREIFPQKYFKFYILNFTFAELSALLLSTAPFHIYYSQEARPYALVAFLASLSMYFFLKEKWLGYIAATALALYSGYFVVFVVLAQILVILLRRRFNLLLYCYIAILLFLPWLPMFFKQIQVGQQAVFLLPEWGRLVNVDFLKALPLTFIKFAIGRIIIFNKAFYVMIAGVLFMVYGLVITKGFFQKGKFTIYHLPFTIFLWLIIPLLSAWFLSLFIPNYQPFRLLLSLPAFYLLLTWGILRFSSKVVQAILPIFILGVNLISVGVYYSNSYFHREDWRGVVQFIESQDKTGIAILPSQTSNWPWKYYSSGKVEVIGISSRVGQVTAEDLQQFPIPNSLPRRQAGQFPIYYIRYLQPVFDPEEKILSWLTSSGYAKIREVSFNQIPIWEYGFGK